MKLTRADLPKIQTSLVSFVAIVAIGWGVGAFTANRTQLAQVLQKTAANERSAFTTKLKQVRDEENEIKEKSALFSQLQARGAIGEEQRLDWIELLKEIRDKRRLIDLQYELSAQRPLDANPGNDLAFYASTMRLQLKLLHEEDLTRLLNDLRKEAKALIHVKSCNITRLPRSGPERSDTLAQLQAECQIDWVTLREVNKK
jgi:hypothetical protein